MIKRRTLEKGIMCMILVLVLCMAPVNLAFAELFGEVQIFALKAKGIVVGFEDSTMRWGEGLSRAQAVKMIVNAMGFAELVERMPSFPPAFADVPKDHWAARYVTIASELGIVDGFPDGTFRPDKRITMAEYAVMLSRMYTALGGVRSEQQIAAEIDPQWAAKEILGIPDLLDLMGLRNRASVLLDYEISRLEGARLIYEVMVRYGLMFDISGIVSAFDTKSGCLTVKAKSSGATLDLKVTSATRYAEGQKVVSLPPSLSGRQASIILGRDGNCAFVLVQ